MKEAIKLEKKISDKNIVERFEEINLENKGLKEKHEASNLKKLRKQIIKMVLF